MCLAGHIVDSIDLCPIDECLLLLPMKEMFQIITGDLFMSEGCYLYFGNCKYKWIRSGKTPGEGKDEYFAGRGAKHEKNAKLKDQMRVHCLYREYPAEGRI